MRVHLVGALGDKFGTEPINLKARNPAQMFRGLENLVEGWEEEVCNLVAHNAKVCVVAGNSTTEQYQNIGPNSLNAPFADDVEDVFIVSSVSGAGIEIGATIMFMGFTGWAAVAAYVVFNIAVGLIVGAITQMLAPSPSTGGEQKEDQSSFIFNGPVNVTRQGVPVPLVYGRCLVGSVVISAGVYTEEMVL